MSWVAEAEKRVVCDTGQIGSADRRALDAAVRKGTLAKWRGHWYPEPGAQHGIGPRKTCWGPPGLAQMLAGKRNPRKSNGARKNPGGRQGWRKTDQLWKAFGHVGEAPPPPSRDPVEVARAVLARAQADPLTSPRTLRQLEADVHRALVKRAKKSPRGNPVDRTDYRAGSNRVGTPLHIWLDNVLGLAGVTDAQSQPHRALLSRWYHAGEPAWMAADGLKHVVRLREKMAARLESSARRNPDTLSYQEYRRIVDAADAALHRAQREVGATRTSLADYRARIRPYQDEHQRVTDAAWAAYKPAKGR